MSEMKTQKEYNNQEESKVLYKIKLTENEKQLFHNALKRGIYKELYRKNMLTDEQLNQLLTQNR